jgi:ribosomal protein L35AE/L33A
MLKNTYLLWLFGLALLSPNLLATSPSTLQFSLATYSVTEDGGSVEITVTRVGGSDGAVSVQYASSDETATAGEDYIAVSGTLNWGDGDVSNKTIIVPIIDDANIEGDETFLLTLKNATGGVIIGNPSTAVVAIINTDCLLPSNGSIQINCSPQSSTLQFSSATYSVNEGGGSIKFTVTRIGGSNGAVSVNIVSSDGTAKAGEDYTKVKGKLKWADGDTSDKSFKYDGIIDDTICEDDENFYLHLKNPVGDAIIGDPDTAEVTIIDDDDNCLDHFKCYAVKGYKDKPVKVDLEDQFGPDHHVKVIIKPKMLCNPVMKWHDEEEFPVNNPEEHLVCYKIKSNVADKKVIVANQFGDKQELTVGKSKLLCVPSKKFLLHQSDEQPEP